MARCGCVTSASGCECELEVLDTASLNLTLTGEGSSDSPWVLSGVASGGGGGAAIDSFIFIGTDSGAAIANATPTTIALNSAAFGGAVYTLRGTDLSWAIGNPTRINILTTGVYDLLGYLLYVNGGAAPITAHTYVSLNGGTAYGTDGFQLMGPAVIIPNGAVNSASADFNFHALALSAGDYLELTTYVLGTGSSYSYGGISVTRRV